MDYQRACGCRMGRPYAQSPFRTAHTVEPMGAREEMRELHQEAMRGASCEIRHEERREERCEERREERRERNDRDMHDHCCGDPYQNYPSLAIVYSPSQVWQKLYKPCEAFANGTLFYELYKPWEGCGRSCGRTGGRMR